MTKDEMRLDGITDHDVSLSKPRDSEGHGGLECFHAVSN